MPSLKKSTLSTRKLSASERIVIKVGSALLSTPKGINLSFLKSLSAEVAQLHKEKKKVVVVSSGAIRCGERLLPSHQKKKTSDLQAAAAVGQPMLMQHYMRLFQQKGLTIAQALLTRDDLSDRQRHQNAKSTFLTLWERGIVPIVNENDSVATEEIKAMRFGDNDILAALVCQLLQADALLILTDVDGFFVKGELQPRLENPRAFLRYAGGAKQGFGGMRNKLKAAAMVQKMGGETFLASGRHPQVVRKLLHGEPLGTYIPAAKKRLSLRKSWIAFCVAKKGTIVINAGAAEALFQRRSLLPSGVVAVQGSFLKSEGVVICTERGERVGSGISAYDSAELCLIKGRKTKEILPILGSTQGDEVVHKDNLVLHSELEQR